MTSPCVSKTNSFNSYRSSLSAFVPGTRCSWRCAWMVPPIYASRISTSASRSFLRGPTNPSTRIISCLRRPHLLRSPISRPRIILGEEGLPKNQRPHLMLTRQRFFDDEGIPDDPFLKFIDSRAILVRSRNAFYSRSTISPTCCTYSHSLIT